MVSPTLGVLLGPDRIATLLEKVDVPVDRLFGHFQLSGEGRRRELARADQLDQPVVTIRNRERAVVAHTCPPPPGLCLTRSDRLVKVGSGKESSKHRPCINAGGAQRESKTVGVEPHVSGLSRGNRAYAVHREDAWRRIAAMHHGGQPEAVFPAIEKYLERWPHGQHAVETSKLRETYIAAAQQKFGKELELLERDFKNNDWPAVGARLSKLQAAATTDAQRAQLSKIRERQQEAIAGVPAEFERLRKRPLAFNDDDIFEIRRSNPTTRPQWLCRQKPTKRPVR